MEARKKIGRARWILAAILIVAAATRLYKIDAPLLDQLYVKQVYVANKARSIAQGEWNPLRDSLDFLDERGRRNRLIEEIPVFTGILGACYRAFGEREWIGRGLSIAATLAAIAALFGLVRREYDDETAIVAALLFAASPLLIFHGRAVLPDTAMLAALLASAWAYRVAQDKTGRARVLWWIATAALGLLSAMFKYYGLIVLFPLLAMTYRRDGVRGCLGVRFVAIALAMIAPIAVWLAVVFVPNANPTSKTIYTVLQHPVSLVSPRLYECLFFRFPVKDNGPVASLLMLLGFVAAFRKRVDARAVLPWAIAGMFFFFLFAPKVVDHDYYELIMLPSAAILGALGWSWARKELSRFAPKAAQGIALGTLGLAVLIQAPWIMGRKYDVEVGQLILAERLERLASPKGRIVVIGHLFSWPIVHYSNREGWIVQETTLPRDWSKRLARYRSEGAEYVALYFDPYSTSRDRAGFEPLRSSLFEIERKVGPWFRDGRPVEYVIYSWREPEKLADARNRRDIEIKNKLPAGAKRQ